MNHHDDSTKIKILMVFFFTFYLMIFSVSSRANSTDCFLSRDEKVCDKPNYDYEDQLIEKYLSGFGEGNDNYELNKELEIGSFQENIQANWDAMNESAVKSGVLFDTIVLPMINEFYPELLDFKTIRVKRNKRYIEKKVYKHKKFLRKIRKSIVKNIILSDLLSNLYDLQLNDEINIYFAMAHPFYDAVFDMDFDDVPYSRREMAVRVRKIISGDYNLEGITKIESLIIEITKRLYSRIPTRNKERFFKELKKLDAAQFLSLSQQNNPDLTKIELKNTILKKGGLSLELYALLADKDFSDYELDLFFIFGAGLQNADDIEDISEDLRDGAITLATEELITPFEILNMVQISFGMLDQMVQGGQYNETKVENFKKAINLFVLTAGKAFETYMQRDPSLLKALKGIIKVPAKVLKKASFYVLGQFYPLIKELHGNPKIKFL